MNPRDRTRGLQGLKRPACKCETRVLTSFMWIWALLLLCPAWALKHDSCEAGESMTVTESARARRYDSSSQVTETAAFTCWLDKLGCRILAVKTRCAIVFSSLYGRVFRSPSPALPAAFSGSRRARAPPTPATTATTAPVRRAWQLCEESASRGNTRRKPCVQY